MKHQTFTHNGKPVYRIVFVNGSAMYVQTRHNWSEGEGPLSYSFTNVDFMNVVTGADVWLNFENILFIEDRFDTAEVTQITLAIEDGGFKPDLAQKLIIPGKRGGHH